MISRFLPKDFDLKHPIAILAGKGLYPHLLIDQLQAAGAHIHLIAFKGEADPELIQRLSPSVVDSVEIGQVGHWLKCLKQSKARYAMMVGQITPKRLFKGLNPDFKAILLLARLKERNAATIFGALAEAINKLGICLLDARSFLDTYVADSGFMTAHRKWKYTDSALSQGVHIAKTIAELNIGQGVVINKGTVLAVEAFEGTNEMLRRAATFGAELPLFIKTVKPQQDYRFDVPVIGLHTIQILAEAGIRHVAVEAHNTLILQKSAVLEAANKQGIMIMGYTITNNK